MEYLKSNISGLREKLDKREISVKELTDLFLDEIKKANPKMGALASITEEEAYKGAETAQKAIDKGSGGALCGIPAVLKDNICTDGVLTECSTRMLANFIPPYDAAVTEKLKEAGYVLLGKTSLDELDIPAGDNKPGGTGTAVAEGLCAFGLGSVYSGENEEGASLLPGIKELRPTYGRVSRHGIISKISSVERPAIVTRAAIDCGTVLNVISGPDIRDMNTRAAKPVPLPLKDNKNNSIKGLRISSAADFEELNTVFKKHGAVVSGFSLPFAEYARDAYSIIGSAEISANLSKLDGIKYGLRGEGRTYEEMLCDSRNRGFGDEVKHRILLGNFFLLNENYNEYFQKAAALREALINGFNEIFNAADIIAADFGSDITVYGAELAGLPVLSSGKTSFIGRRFGEEALIKAVNLLEAEELL